MAVNLSPLAGAGWQFFSDNGVPLSGGLLYTYAAGTTTPLATYTTNAGNVAHSNPIVLNSVGRVSTGEVWITTQVSYKFVLYDSTNVLIATWDNIIAGETAATLFYNRGVTNAVNRTIQSKLNDFVSALDFGVATTNTATQNTTYLQNAINYAASVGASLYIPNGQYNFNGQLNLCGSSTVPSIQLLGDAPNINYGSWNDTSATPYGTVLIYSGSTWPAIKTGQGRDISITNIVLKGSGKTNAGSIGIGINGGNSGFNMTNSKVQNFETGIKFGYDVDGNADVNQLWNVQINQCYTGIWFSKSQNYINNIYNPEIIARTCIRSDGPAFNVYGGIMVPAYVTINTESVWSDTVASVSGQNITLTSGANLVAGQFMIVQGNNTISTTKFPYNSPLGEISSISGAQATLSASSFAGGIVIGATVYYGYPQIVFKVSSGANIIGVHIEGVPSQYDSVGYAPIITYMSGYGTLSLTGSYINQGINDSTILYNKLLPTIVHTAGSGEYTGNQFTAPYVKVQQQSNTPLYFKDTKWDTLPLIIGGTGYYPNGNLIRQNDFIVGNWGDPNNNLANLFIQKPYYNPENGIQVAPQTNGDIFYQSGSTPPTTAISGQYISVTGTNSTSYLGWKNTQTDSTNGIHTNASISTTGAITSGTNVLTVASVANFQQFMTIKITNAAAGPADLTTRIELIDGKNKQFYLADNAGTTQATASVTPIQPNWYQAGMVWKEANLSYAGGTISNAASTTVTGTLTGAALGDYVIASSNIDLQGCLISANVTSTNNVKVTIANLTGGSITLGAATIRARTIK